MLSHAQAQRYADEGIAVYACHPGDSESRLSRDLGFGGSMGAADSARTPAWLATCAEPGAPSGSYFAHCGVPDTTSIHICAAVQNGRAVGVTVRTAPGSKKLSRCIAAGVRGLSFPSHPRMDVTRTTFE